MMILNTYIYQGPGTVDHIGILSSPKFCTITDLFFEFVCVRVFMYVCICLSVCIYVWHLYVGTHRDQKRSWSQCNVFMNPIFPVNPLTSLFYGPRLQLKMPFSFVLDLSYLYTSHPPSSHPLEEERHLLFEKFTSSSRMDWVPLSARMP